jgi:hypothetical protein
MYALLIGQCSQGALRNRMEVNERWGCINDTSDIMELLQLIQGCMIQHQTRQKPVHSLSDAETRIFQFKQKGLANNDNYEKFKDLVSITECLGSDIGAHSDRVDMVLLDITVDPDLPTAAEENERRMNT